MHSERTSDAVQAPPHLHRRLETRDVDDQSTLLSSWNQTYQQVSPGRFSGSFEELRFGDTYLFREVTSAALYQVGYLPDDYCAIGIPMALNGPATFCGQACDDASIHVFSGRDGFEFSSPSGLDIVGVVIPREALLARPSEGGNNDGTAISDVPHLKPLSYRTMYCLREMIVTMLARPSDASDSEIDFNSFRQDLHELVAEALFGGPDPAIPSSRRMRIVREACALAASEPGGEPMSIDLLCSTLGISRRTLQYSFNDVTGMAPGSYLRFCRLNGARRSIKAGASVTDAATSWGFWHLGRFAHDYADLFAERPSTTMHRAAGSRSDRRGASPTPARQPGPYVGVRR